MHLFMEWPRHCWAIKAGVNSSVKMNRRDRPFLHTDLLRNALKNLWKIQIQSSVSPVCIFFFLFFGGFRICCSWSDKDHMGNSKIIMSSSRSLTLILTDSFREEPSKFYVTLPYTLDIFLYLDTWQDNVCIMLVQIKR